MEVQLQELLDKIKDEGVKAAELESARIRQAAEKKAEEMLLKAQKEASEIIAKARAEAARFEQTSKEMVKQAGRNTILGLRKSILDVYSAVIQTETREALSEKTLEEAIVILIKSWADKKVSELEVLLSPKDLAKIESRLRTRLAEELKKGVELKPFPGLAAGFRIGMKDGAAYYNFTDQGIAEIMSEYLNPKLSELINQAVSKES